MALEFSTAGITLKYAVQSGASRPTTSYITIPDIVSMDDVNAEPSNIDVTNLADLISKRSIAGLKDESGMFTCKVNGTQDFKTKWKALVSAAETAKAGNKQTFFEVVIPGFDESFYFAGDPQPMGFFGAEVDNAYAGNVYISKNEIVGFASKST